MNRSKLFLFLGIATCFLLFQNFAFIQTPYRGGIAGIAPFDKGLMIWGWACKFEQSSPVKVNLYFSEPSSNSKKLWRTVLANQKNTSTAEQMLQLCGTTNSDHEFKIHIPYPEALDFNNHVVTAEVVDEQTTFALPKYSSYPNVLQLDPELSYTRNGWIKGQSTKQILSSTSVVSFKGIPYAAPPLGERRWAASVPPTNWSGIKTTTAFGPPCMQENEHYVQLGTAVPRSEDCLYLNVWKPINKKNRPVIVYIHGGQFKGGWSGLPDYDGAYLASQDIVFVSFNYRVGMMGFFTHPLFDRIGRRNINFGITDQELALQWVKNNIAEFGGDPNNVTLAGSSAGGASVGYWLSNKEATGLFHKGIIESGGGSLTRWLENREITKDRGTHLTDELINLGLGKDLNDCRDVNSTESASDSCIKQLLFNTPIEELSKASLFSRYKKNGIQYDPVRNKTGFEYHPVLDHKYVLGGTLDVFRCNQQKNLPLIVGSMGWEANIVESAINANPQPFFEKIPESLIRPKYSFPTTGQTELLAELFYADKTFAVPAELLARFHSQKNRNTYLYFFNYIGDNMSDVKGARHQLLTPFVFRTLETTGIKDVYLPSSVDRAVASVWSGYWQSFIERQPNLVEEGITSKTVHSPPTWMAYNPSVKNRLFVNHSGKIVAPGQREFGGRQTYNFDLQGPMASRYQFIETYFFPSNRFSLCE